MEELREGSQWRAVGKVAYRLNWQMGISIVEIARHLGVEASAIAMAIRKEERENIFDYFEQRPLFRGARKE